MLSVLLLLAAAIAYFFLHKKTVEECDKANCSKNIDEEIKAAHSTKFVEVCSHRSRSNVLTANSPSSSHFWNVSDVATCRSASRFDYMRLEYLTGALGSTSDVLTARSPRHLNAVCAKSVEELVSSDWQNQMANLVTAHSISSMEINDPILNTGRSNIDDTILADTFTAEWNEDDLFTCISQPEPTTAVEGHFLEPIKSEPSDVDKYKYVNFNRGFIAPDPATESAQKSMNKKKRKRKSKNKSAMLSTKSDTNFSANASETSVVMDEAITKNLMVGTKI